MQIRAGFEYEMKKKHINTDENNTQQKRFVIIRWTGKQ